MTPTLLPLGSVTRITNYDGNTNHNMVGATVKIVRVPNVKHDCYSVQVITVPNEDTCTWGPEEEVLLYHREMAPVDVEKVSLYRHVKK